MLIYNFAKCRYGCGTCNVIRLPNRVDELFLNHIIKFQNCILDVGICGWQRSRGPEMEVGGSPAYGRGSRHSRAQDWRSRSPDQYYSRNYRHYSSRSPRRSRSWSPAKRREEHHKSWSRHGHENSTWTLSPAAHHRGE